MPDLTPVTDAVTAIITPLEQERDGLRSANEAQTLKVTALTGDLSKARENVQRLKVEKATLSEQVADLTKKLEGPRLPRRG